MKKDQNLVLEETKIQINNILQKVDNEDVIKEIIKGLTSSPKYISPKYFYDEIGSELFEEITALEEYYPTRTEKSLIPKLGKILDLDSKPISVIEIGSGDASKISLLFGALSSEIISKMTYVPLDISQSAIEKSSQILVDKFPLREIYGYVADFNTQLQQIKLKGRKLICFFGSTIGNYAPQEARKLLTKIGLMMDEGDIFVLGVDMVKNSSIIEKAYDDEKGVTAKFNKNILNVINKELGTQIPLSDFEHYSYYNEQKQRIEMHLRALEAKKYSSVQRALEIEFTKGETIHTENSHKFTNEDIKQFAKWTNTKLAAQLSDNNEWFNLVVFEK